MADLEAPGLSGRLTFRGTAAGDGATPVAGKGRIALTATGFAAPGIAGGVSGALSAEMGIGAGTITLATARPVVLTLKDLSPPLAEVVGRLAAPTDQPLRLTLSALDNDGPDLTFTGLDDLVTLAVASDGIRLTAEHGRPASPRRRPDWYDWREAFPALPCMIFPPRWRVCWWLACPCARPSKRAMHP